jgi:hypothetical protein
VRYPISLADPCKKQVDAPEVHRNERLEAIGRMNKRAIRIVNIYWCAEVLVH